jgi:UMP-CMP kinase
LDGFPRSLNNMEAWYQIFGRDSELPTMLYFECPYDVLEKRILVRAKYSGRSDDNVDSLKHRFDTYKEATLPTVELFKQRNKCIEIDTSNKKEIVYARVVECLSEYTDDTLIKMPLSNKSEILLGLRPYPPRS